MVRRAKTAEATAETAAETEAPEKDIFDEQAELRRQEAAARQAQAAQIVQQVAAATAMPPENGHAAQHAPQTNGHAAAVQKKKYVPPVNPFGFENEKGASNRVQLLKSESEEQRRRGQGEGAWVIRFAHNPNDDKGPNGETYSKENPHPVLTMLKKEEGYRWDFDADGKGGWGKPFSGDAYGQDHIDARRVLEKAAEMIGAPKESFRIPD